MNEKFNKETKATVRVVIIATKISNSLLRREDSLDFSLHFISKIEPRLNDLSL